MLTTCSALIGALLFYGLLYFLAQRSSAWALLLSMTPFSVILLVYVLLQPCAHGEHVTFTSAVLRAAIFYTFSLGAFLICWLLLLRYLSCQPYAIAVSGTLALLLWLLLASLVMIYCPLSRPLPSLGI